MDLDEEQLVRKIELEFERVIYQQCVNARDLHNLKVRIFEYPEIQNAFIVQAQMLLAGEVIEERDFNYPKDWKSACWNALATHWREKGWIGLAVWARKKVRYKTHTWKVRREWLDEKPIDGRRTKVIAYFDGEPMLGSKRNARHDFLEKYAELRYAVLSQAGLSGGEVSTLIHDLLTAAEHVPWRFILHEVGADAARNHRH